MISFMVQFIRQGLSFLPFSRSGQACAHLQTSQFQRYLLHRALSLDTVHPHAHTNVYNTQGQGHINIDALYMGNTHQVSQIKTEAQLFLGILHHLPSSSNTYLSLWMHSTSRALW